MGGIEKLSNAIANFSQYIRKLPILSLELSNSQEWGPKEVLIHLVAWHEYYISILHELLLGKKPELIKGTLKEQNKLAVEKNRDKSIESLLLRLKTAEEELKRIYSYPNAKKLHIALKVGGKARPLNEIIRLDVAHFRRHQQQLQKAGYRLEGF